MHASSPSGSGNSSGTGAARGTASGMPPEGRGKTGEQETKIRVSEAKPRRPRNSRNMYDYLDWPLPHSPQFDGSVLNPVPRKPPGSPQGVQADSAGEPHRIFSPVTTPPSTSSTSSTQTLTTTTTVATTTTTTATTIAVNPNNGGDTAASVELGKLLSGHHKRQGFGWNSFDAEDAPAPRQEQAWNPREDELIGIILDRERDVLIEEESMTICAAARQSSTMALEMLMQPERAIAFHPLDRARNRGWHPEHCPFRCAVDHNRPDNLKLLLKHGVRPGAAFEQTLRHLPRWAKDILREYDYML